MPKSTLKLNDLKLQVHLGVTPKERAKKQTIYLNLTLDFQTPPAGCLTDSIKDTLCYETLTNQLRESLGKKPFHLVEHLAHDIHSIIKTKATNIANVSVTVTKFPKISGLTGGICFHYSDTIETVG